MYTLKLSEIERGRSEVPDNILNLWTSSLKVSKNEQYKLSHKRTKNTSMVLFLITVLLQTPK